MRRSRFKLKFRHQDNNVCDRQPNFPLESVFEKNGDLRGLETIKYYYGSNQPPSPSTSSINFPFKAITRSKLPFPFHFYSTSTASISHFFSKMQLVSCNFYLYSLHANDYHSKKTLGLQTYTTSVTLQQLMHTVGIATRLSPNIAYLAQN